MVSGIKCREEVFMEIKLLGLVNKEVIEEQVRICAAAGKLSRMQGTVGDAYESVGDPEKALKFVKRVINMGHTATIDHDYMVFSLSGVTPVVEQTIIEERFSSFTIKSRREVNFSNPVFYVPDFHDKDGNLLENNEELKAKYIEHMNSLFDEYSSFVDNGIPKEDARFLLPYCFHSEIIMGLDGTSLVRMINSLTKGKLSNITELRDFGNQLLEIAKVRAPYIGCLIKDEIKNYSDLEEILYGMDLNVSTDDVGSPVLVDATENIDQTLIINAIARKYNISIKTATKVYEDEIKGNSDVERQIMRAIFTEEGHEDLKQVHMRFNLSIPFAILTHLTRHRRLSLTIPDFVPNVSLSSYLIPPSIMRSDLKEEFEDVFKRNNEVYLQFKQAGVRDEDLVYFVLGGVNSNIVINCDGEALRWLCRLRECIKAQWCVRGAVTKMHEEIGNLEGNKYFSENLGPDCVVNHFCGEGKESCGRIDTILKRIRKRED